LCGVEHKSGYTTNNRALYSGSLVQRGVILNGTA
jgi:hypothetical protein